MGLTVLEGNRWNKMILQRLTTAKAVSKYNPVGQEWKCEDRRRLDTFVFHALNDTTSVIGLESYHSREIGRFRVMGKVWLQDWNLNKLTGRSHKTWIMRLNLTQHENLTRPYVRRSNRLRVLLQFGKRWCMAAASSWRELSALLR